MNTEAAPVPPCLSSLVRLSGCATVVTGWTGMPRLEVVVGAERGSGDSCMNAQKLVTSRGTSHTWVPYCTDARMLHPKTHRGAKAP